MPAHFDLRVGNHAKSEHHIAKNLLTPAAKKQSINRTNRGTTVNIDLKPPHLDNQHRVETKRG